NMLALRYAEDILVIDAGLMFPEQELLGVDIVIPDITYLKQHRQMVRAIVLTHAHEDHIGAVPYILGDLNVPVYGTQFTLALAIRTPIGVIIHTGDFKIDPTPVDGRPFDLHAFARYGQQGVLALFSDSTNVERPGFTPSERAVVVRLEELFRAAPRRVIISCFSSSIHRIQQVIDVARGTGRKIGFVGRSMVDNVEIAHSL